MRIKTIIALNILILWILLLALPCFSADSYTIHLQMEPMPVHSDDFYIKKVLDSRSDKSTIGFVQIGALNFQVPANFDGDLVNVFQAYFNLCFPVDNSKIPIIVVVDRLKVSEREQFSGEYGRAEIKLKFYRTVNNKMGKVFETEAISDIRGGWDVTKYHEANIRSAIEKCFTSFVNSKWKTVEVDWEEESIFESNLERLRIF